MDDLAQLIDARAENDGTEAFLESASSSRRITYADCAAAVGAWRWELARRVPAGAAVTLSIVDPLDFCLAFLGTISSGRRALPIDPALPQGLRAAAVPGTDAVITDRPLNDSPVVQLRADAYRTADGCVPGSAGTLELPSSGTTGPPKQVRLTEKQLLYTATNIARHHRIVPGERGFSPLPLFHINAEVVGVLATLIGGATLVLDDGFHRSRFWRVVRSHGVTWVNAVPAIISILANDESGPGQSFGLRFIRSASAPLPDITRARFEKRFGVPVVESYGMTEAGSQITVNPLDQTRPGSVGRPVGVELEIRDGRRRPVPPGRTGTVVIRGPGVIRAYAAGGLVSIDPAGWLDTGDLGYVDPDGFLFLAGRRDDIINRGGEKVLPRTVEERLLAHPAVLAAAVVKAPHPTLGEVPEAFVVCRSTSAARDDDLLGWCRAGLAPPLVPMAVHLVDALPTGPTGKVRRRVLAAQHGLAGA